MLIFLFLLFLLSLNTNIHFFFSGFSQAPKQQNYTIISWLRSPLESIRVNYSKTTKIQSVEESFRVNYFLVVVDMAIASLKDRFEQLNIFENIFEFLFDSKKLKSLGDNELRESCTKFKTTFSHNNLSDVDANDLFFEMKVLQMTLPNVLMSPLEIVRPEKFQFME